MVAGAQRVCKAGSLAALKWAWQTTRLTAWCVVLGLHGLLACVPWWQVYAEA
jgi:hypothetical protein